MYRILVTGSRYWSDWDKLSRALKKFASYSTDKVVIVHGDCPTGADFLAEQWAKDHGFTTEKYPANWTKYGRSAGPKRNQVMVNLGADLCVAFPLDSSRGTVDCMNKAKAAGIPIKVVK